MRKFCKVSINFKKFQKKYFEKYQNNTHTTYFFVFFKLFSYRIQFSAPGVKHAVDIFKKNLKKQHKTAN